MSAMKSTLAQIEARLQALIEGGAARLFPSSHRQNDLAFRLVEAMQRGLRQKADGTPVAPNLYIVRAHPNQIQVLQKNRILLDSLTQVLRDSGIEAGLTFAGPPVIRLEIAPELAPGTWEVFAQNSLQDLPQTSDLELDQPEESSVIPPNAFVIVDGTQIFALNQPVLTIGRRADNHLVVNDPRVSRVHAQLRAVRGRYVIFDLGSTGGTQINGEPVHQGVLYPGDVITLAGVPLVYGQDPIDDSDTGDIRISDTVAFRPDEPRESQDGKAGAV